MPANVVDAAAMERLILSSPFHAWLGLRLVELGTDHIAIALPWREELIADPTARYTHGGILATLIDLAADYAVAAKLGRGVPTIDMRVDYHKAALPGEELIGRGRVIKLGRTVATAEATVSKTDGTLIASGRGVYLTSAG
ncbi:MAG: PaaI family thioesterase [Alphaproteobacteria bacterium]|nr:PaaI family thioesterase [Alphaproteobacteria bacterium]